MGGIRGRQREQIRRRIAEVRGRAASVISALSLLGTMIIGICPARADEAWKRIRTSGELRWGADVNGGAPYVFRDSENPDKIIGFEVDIMRAVAQGCENWYDVQDEEAARILKACRISPPRP